MRLRRVAFRGITRFTSAQPASLEFDGLGELVAVVGRNGHGKTTALEAAAAALYKTLPSRPGSLYEHCHGRDAFVEAVFDDHGSEVKVRVQVDVEARKTEGYIFLDGAAITTGRSAEFEAEIEKRFGSLELFLASAFSAQNRAGNFLLMQKGDRKALFVELLGLRHLEVLQEGAKVRRGAAETVVAGARAVLASNEAETAGLREAEGRLAIAQNAADAAAHALEAARSEEAAAVAALERARTAGARLAALEQAAGAAKREAAAADVALAEAINLAPRAREDADRRRKALETQDLDGQERRARERNTRAIEALTTRRVNAEELLAEAPAVEAAVAELPGLRSDRDEIQADEKHAEELGRAVLAAEAHLAAAERRVKDAQTTAERERARLERQAGLLGQVPCTESLSWFPNPDESSPVDLAGRCPLLADARRAKDAAAAVAVDPSISEEVETHRKALEQSRAEHQDAVLACDSIRLQEVEARISELDAIAGLVPLVEEARRQIGALEAERKAADAELESELRRVAAARDAAASTAHEIERELDRALDHADARVSDLRESLAAAEGRAGKAEQDLTAARKEGALTVPQAQASLSEARDTRVKGEQRLRTGDQERATLDARVSVLREKEAGLSRLRDAVSQAEQEVGDWTLLEKALGRDGVQALEIDAAGPEVARITNELLEACYGPRFSISFETLREKRSSRGEYSEAFDVRVFDRGNERTVEALSGGERVIVGEAIGLSLSIFNSRKSGIRWETLWRDETAGALDPENASAYVDMLRRALALGGFAQVIFVSHQPEVWERADSRLFVADGRVKQEAARTAESVPA